MHFLLSVVTLWKRELVRFFRQPSRIFGALGTPLIFWLLLGSGIGSSFQLPDTSNGMNYMEFFYAGTILLVLLFTTIFSSLSLIEDRKEGFLLSVLVAPVSRYAIVLGKTLGSATLAFLQGLLLVFLAPWLNIPLGLGRFLALSVVLFLVAFCLSALGFATAWVTESMQGYHSVMNVLLFPMWLLSGAIFPPDGAFRWVQWVMLFNPLTYALSLLRFFIYWDPPVSGPSFEASLLVTVIFGILVFLFSLRLVKRGKVVGLV